MHENFTLNFYHNSTLVTSQTVYSHARASATGKVRSISFLQTSSVFG